MGEQADTQKFMSVESFSQLPFIRPSASTGLEKPSPSSSSPGIRLFGFEVPQETITISPDHNDEDTKQQTTTPTTTTTTNGGSNTENNRKFECHYCCRNFPTSQALGGHQNAHKRERQHAKRAHLQSALAAAHHYHHNNNIDGGHRSIYGFLNYPHRLASLPSTVQYPTWNGSVSMGPRVYGGLGSVAQPINGNPLPGLWRVPVARNGGLDVRFVHQDYQNQQHQGLVPLQLPSQLLQSENQGTVGIVAAEGYPSPISSTFSSSRSLQNQMVCEVKENVSLDLHL